MGSPGAPRVTVGGIWEPTAFIYACVLSAKAARATISCRRDELDLHVDGRFIQQLRAYTRRVTVSPDLPRPLSNTVRTPTAKSCLGNRSTDRSNNKPLKQPINESINRSTDQSTNQPAKQSTDQSINQPINQPTNRSIN